jgi:hypothetical protein
MTGGCVRGKKINNEFVSNFVLECVAIGKTSKEEISEIAKQKIDQIDEYIKTAEELKKTRSKLHDVLLSFEGRKVKDKSEDRVALQEYVGLRPLNKDGSRPMNKDSFVKYGKDN